MKIETKYELGQTMFFIIYEDGYYGLLKGIISNIEFNEDLSIGYTLREVNNENSYYKDEKAIYSNIDDALAFLKTILTSAQEDE